MPDRANEERLWVQEGQLDLPIYFPDNWGDETLRGFCLDFSNFTGDGFIEIRTVDSKRTSEQSWWSLDEKVLFDFRTSIIAEGLGEALARSASFIEQMLDRLTFLSGAPATLVELGLFYDEEELEECIKGQRPAFTASIGGTFCRTTTPFANVTAMPNMKPTVGAKRALRWFRKALSSESVEDRFLAYYVSLECISNDVKETTTKTQICQSCGESTGNPKAQTEGIKWLLKQRGLNPSKDFRKLTNARGKLVHGEEIDVAPLESLIQRIAADGIAHSLGIDPDTISFADSARPKAGLIVEVPLSPELPLLAKWKGESIRTHIEELRIAATRTS